MGSNQASQALKDFAYLHFLSDRQKETLGDFAYLHSFIRLSTTCAPCNIGSPISIVSHRIATSRARMTKYSYAYAASTRPTAETCSIIEQECQHRGRTHTHVTDRPDLVY